MQLATVRGIDVEGTETVTQTKTLQLKQEEGGAGGPLTTGVQ